MLILLSLYGTYRFSKNWIKRREQESYDQRFQLAMKRWLGFSVNDPWSTYEEHFYTYGNVQNASKARLFFFGEEHTNQTHHALQVAYTSAMGEEGDCILLEGVQAREKFPNEGFITSSWTSTFVEPWFNPKFSVFGWDLLAPDTTQQIQEHKRIEKLLTHYTKELGLAQSQRRQKIAEREKASALEGMSQGTRSPFGKIKMVATFFRRNAEINSLDEFINKYLLLQLEMYRQLKELVNKMLAGVSLRNQSLIETILFFLNRCHRIMVVTGRSHLFNLTSVANASVEYHLRREHSLDEAVQALRAFLSESGYPFMMLVPRSKPKEILAPVTVKEVEITP